jgi:Na+/proline symporter
VTHEKLVSGLIIILIYLVGITFIASGQAVKNPTSMILPSAAVDTLVAVLASIIAAETSAATFLGAPAEGYRTQNILYVQLTLGTI